MKLFKTTFINWYWITSVIDFSKVLLSCFGFWITWRSNCWFRNGSNSSNSRKWKNLSAYTAGDAVPYIITDQFRALFVMIAFMSLVIAILIVSKKATD